MLYYNSQLRNVWNGQLLVSYNSLKWPECNVLLIQRASTISDIRKFGLTFRKLKISLNNKEKQLRKLLQRCINGNIPWSIAPNLLVLIQRVYMTVIDAVLEEQINSEWSILRHSSCDQWEKNWSFLNCELTEKNSELW